MTTTSPLFEFLLHGAIRTYSYFTIWERITSGCSFCSAGGSGEFAVTRRASSSGSFSPDPGIVTRQIDEGIKRLRSGRKYCGERYIAYFQSYSNTYAPVSYLRSLYQEALTHPQTAALSIATRPDCFSPEIYELLSECQQQKPVWVELGLQTMHDSTARIIHRGYPLSCFDATVRELRRRGIPVIVHVILGLPGEDHHQMLQTIRYLNETGISGIKLQLLHVLKGTDLADLYASGRFQTLELPEYLELIGDCLKILPQETVIHRISGDGPKSILIAPEWSGNKRLVLNSIAQYLKEHHIFQGMGL